MPSFTTDEITDALKLYEAFRQVFSPDTIQALIENPRSIPQPLIREQLDETNQDAIVMIKDQEQLASRLKSALLRNGITTLGLLALCTEAEVASWRNIGPLYGDILRKLLTDNELSYRQAGEPLLKKVRWLYPNARTIPVGVLVRLEALDPDSKLNIVNSRHSAQTLGRFVQIGEIELKALIKGARTPKDASTEKILIAQIEAIKLFLSQLGLQLAT